MTPRGGPSPAPSLGEAAARGSGTTLLAQLLRMLLQVGSVVVLARLLAPADFGLVAMVTSVIGIAELVRDFGLSNAAVRAPRLSREQQGNLFWTNTALGLACTAAAAALSPLVALAYGEPRLLGVVLALAGVFTLNGAATQFRVDLTRRLRFGRLVVVDVAGQVAGIAVAVAAAALGAGTGALVAQQLTAAAVGCALAVALSGLRPGLPRRDVPVAPFVRFGGRLLATSTLWYATKNVDNVVLGLTAGPGPLGLYARAYQLLMTPLNQINAPLTRIALPVLSAVQDDDERYAGYLRRAQLVGCYLTTTVLAVAAALSGPLVAVLFGPGWEAVAPVFAVLAVGGVFRATSQLAFWVYVSKGRPGAQFRMLSVVGPVMVLLMVAGAPWGAVGVAAGHSAGHLLYWAVSLWHAGRVTGVRTAALFATALRATALVSAPAAAAAAVGTLLPAPALVQVAAGTGLALVAVALVAALVPPVRRDALVVARLARRALRRPRRAPTSSPASSPAAPSARERS